MISCCLRMTRIGANEEYYSRPSASFAGRILGQRQPLVLQFRVSSKVDKDAQFIAARVEVVDHLGRVLVDQLPHRLDLDDDLPEANEVRLIRLFEALAAVAQRQLRLSDERDVLVRELQRQTFLINGFQESATLPIVDFETGTHDLVALIGK